MTGAIGVTGRRRLLALLGVVAGFLALIVPGVFALRSYRRWQDEIILQPSFAWVMGILALWAAVVVLLLVFTDFLGLAILLGGGGPARQHRDGAEVLIAARRRLVTPTPFPVTIVSTR